MAFFILRQPTLASGRQLALKHSTQPAYSKVSPIQLKPIAATCSQRRWAMTKPTVDLAGRGRPQPSMKLAQEGIERTPRDIGLLPFTYIHPTGSNLPSIFKDPKVRWALFKKWMIYKFYNISGLFFYKFVYKGKIDFPFPKKYALELYNEMYTSYAEANTMNLRQICNDGLFEDFKRRISARRHKVVWQLHTLVKRPKVVSNSACGIGRDTAMRQVVVRIHSRQSISKYDAKNRLIPGREQPKEVIEYLVLQKRRYKSVEGEWAIWGTTEETTLPLLHEQEEKAKALFGQ